jgi:hypothetical protein
LVGEGRNVAEKEEKGDENGPVARNVRVARRERTAFVAAATARRLDGKRFSA